MKKRVLALVICFVLLLVLFVPITTVPSFNKDTHAFRQRKSALTALSSLAYASMPASSSLSSSGFLSQKSPAEFLRGRNGARGSAER